MEVFLKMLKITNNTPTVPAGDDELVADVDEPPDDTVSELGNGFRKESVKRATLAPSMLRRESLLTRAIRGESDTSPVSPRHSDVPRGMSTTSSHSFASTAELTSDPESPPRSASPSPPPPVHRIQFAPFVKPVEVEKVAIAPLAKDDKTPIVANGEAAIEKSLGRKRCIMFACKDSSSENPQTVEVKPKIGEPVNAEPAPRKCRISFACPSRPSAETTKTLAPVDTPRRQSSPASIIHRDVEQDVSQARRATEANSIVHRTTSTTGLDAKPLKPLTSPRQVFHEFAGSHDSNEEWVEKSTEESRPKLTIDDCLKKENAIRKLGEEAEEEAEEEEREQEEFDNEVDDEEVGDDFAPSDEDKSDDGNESDDEEGFADSDDESEAGSEYQFWAPSTTTTNATSTDNLTHFSARQRSRSRASSTSSGHSVDDVMPLRRSFTKQQNASKAIRFRPGTPELPDSTDFVCGTLDEDRPLEAAYISCREQRRRDKLIPIPQDIDPSFPTSDPEDHEEDEDGEDVGESSDHVWMKGQFEGFEDDDRGRRCSAFRVSPLHSPAPAIAPPRPVRLPRPALSARPTLRSPPPVHRHRSPPPKHAPTRSPPPRRLFDQAPRRMRSPPPNGRLHSPRGSPTDVHVGPFGITINHLGQRPITERTSSLPHTPNPFFRNWRKGLQPTSNRITSAAVTPGTDSTNLDLHVRGPVDIVIGLEKKRQKRKEKYWRTHCRKAAKEQAEKKPQPGRGVERMKELGLECAERTRGYGLGQTATQLVLSL